MSPRLDPFLSDWTNCSKLFQQQNVWCETCVREKPFGFLPETQTPFYWLSFLLFMNVLSSVGCKNEIALKGQWTLSKLVDWCTPAIKKKRHLQMRFWTLMNYIILAKAKLEHLVPSLVDQRLSCQVNQQGTTLNSTLLESVVQKTTIHYGKCEDTLRQEVLQHLTQQLESIRWENPWK